MFTETILWDKLINLMWKPRFLLLKGKEKKQIKTGREEEHKKQNRNNSRGKTQKKREKRNRTITHGEK